MTEVRAITVVTCKYYFTAFYIFNSWKNMNILILKSPFKFNFENFIFKQPFKTWIRIHQICWIRIQWIRIWNTGLGASLLDLIFIFWRQKVILAGSMFSKSWVWFHEMCISLCFPWRHKSELATLVHMFLLCSFKGRRDLNTVSCRDS